MDKPKTKVLFIHNMCMWYRKPLFNALATAYDTEFVFTDEKAVEGLNSKYHILKKSGFPLFHITPGLIAILLRKEYDIVILPSFYLPGGLIDFVFCFLIAMLHGKKFIVWLEMWDYRRPHASLFRKFRRYLLKFIIKAAATRADICITCGTKSQEYLLAAGIPQAKICIAPNASVMEHRQEDFSEAQKIADELHIENKKVILYVGRLIRQKGVDYLIRAFDLVLKNNGPAVLMIVGDEYAGRKKDYHGEELKMLTRALGLQDSIYFIGDIPHSQLAPYYMVSDVLVAPSYGKCDVWGFVLNEAMFFGKPVIATNALGGAYDLIKEGVNGFMVLEKNIPALYEAIVKILGNGGLQRQMGEESKRIIDNGFTYHHMTECFKRAIDNIMQQPDKNKYGI